MKRRSFEIWVRITLLLCAGTEYVRIANGQSKESNLRLAQRMLIAQETKRHKPTSIAPAALSCAK